MECASANLHSTFLKRKGGLFKKAHELSVLCSVDVAVIIFGANKKLYEFSSGDINEIIGRHQYVSRLAKVFSGVTDLHSMAAHTNTKARAILPANEMAMDRMTKRWTRQLSRNRCANKTRPICHRTCPAITQCEGRHRPPRPWATA